MAYRVKTNIDLGQNNLLNGGFERVIALPLENNVIGRQVLYQGKPYWWNGKEWISWEDLNIVDFKTASISSEDDVSIASLFTQTDFENYQTFIIYISYIVPVREHLFDDIAPLLKPGIKYNFYIFTTTMFLSSEFSKFLIPTFPINNKKSTMFFLNNVNIIEKSDYSFYYELVINSNVFKIEMLKKFNETGSDNIFLNLDTNADVELATQNNQILTDFISENNVKTSIVGTNFSLQSLLVAVINKLNQGGGGATGYFWSLTQANAETSACEVTINNSNESIFPKVLATYGNYIHSRNIVVDLSNYSDESSYVFDLFGNISNVPTGVRYSIFITGNIPLKLDFPKQYLTNISSIHTPDGAHEESYTIAYSSATKIDFVKLGANKVWVDVSNKM